MLYIVGLGLGDERDITVRGLDAVRRCAKVYMEAYTSLLSLGLDPASLANLVRFSLLLDGHHLFAQMSARPNQGKWSSLISLCCSFVCRRRCTARRSRSPTARW